MARTAVRLIIEGVVQGVGFRWWTLREARRLGLSGWVRNLCDGSVEVLAIGDAAAVDCLVERCRIGPSGAAVARVGQEQAMDDGRQTFDQRPSA